MPLAPIVTFVAGETFNVGMHDLMLRKFAVGFETFVTDSDVAWKQPLRVHLGLFSQAWIQKWVDRRRVNRQG